MTDETPSSPLSALIEAIDQFEETVVAHTAEVAMLRHDVAEQAQIAETQKLLLEKKDQEIKQNRREFRLTILTLAIGFILVLVGQGLYDYFDNKEATKDRKDIKNTLSIVERAVDPTSDLGRRGQEQQAKAIGQIILENDCRTRRALAGLPITLADQPCVLPDTPRQ